MKVAMVNLTSGGLSGGYRKYLDQVVPRLRAHASVGHLDVFVPAGVTPNSHTEPAYETWPAQDGMRGFVSLRARLAELKPDVVFVPTARWVDFGGIPTVVMVRNMEPLERPFAGNTPLEALRNVFRARAARQACLRADHVIAVSRHVREYICERWALPYDKVGVVYHGIESAPPASSQQQPSRLTSDLGSTLFTAGSIRAARGLEDVVKALAIVKREGSALRLAIGGKPDPSSEHYLRSMEKLAASLGVQDDITWLGHLSAAEMSWCFTNAFAFVMTSRCEACPNTALEAMAHGALCVSTDNPPMPEFFEDSALYYAAGDASALAAQLRAIAAAPDSHAELKNAAKRRASQFTWSDTVANTVAELETALR